MTAFLSVLNIVYFIVSYFSIGDSRRNSKFSIPSQHPSFFFLFLHANYVSLVVELNQKSWQKRNYERHYYSHCYK